jgi:stage III sporulation protein AD
MDTFLQVTAGVLLTVVLGLMVDKQSKDMASVLTLAVLCMVLAAIGSFLQPVLDFIRKLQQEGKLDPEMLRIVFKSVGVGVVGEIAATICADSGNSALGKGIQMLSVAVILWLSLPLMESLLDMVTSILGDV